MPRVFPTLICLALCASASAATADADPDPPRTFTTSHVLAIGGARIRYRAVAGELDVTDAAGKPVARVFSTAYLRDGSDSRRPVTFAFNGGPGSASIWLHLGILGPKRVVVPGDAGDDGAAPLDIVANEHSPLDVTDVVLIDPVGTGYSRAIGGHADKEFWGIAQDADLLANFVRQWLTANRRWSSPKYLCGESYGATRAAAMTRALAQEEYGTVALNGVILISAALDFQGLRPVAHNARVSPSHLPSYAATAMYHGKIPRRDLGELLAEAREFALTDYAVALSKGQRLPPEERARVRRRLAGFTGLSERYLDSVDLDVHPFRFMKELLRDEGLSVGRLDSRYTGRDFDAGGERFDVDPSGAGFGADYSAAALDYLSRDLGVDMGDRRYLVLNRSGIKPQWDWKVPDAERWSLGMNPEWPVHVNVAPFLGDEMRRNSEFRILLAMGYYDLATPFFAVESSMYQTGMLPGRVTFAYYDAGHMMYVHEPSLARLAADIRAFVAQPANATKKRQVASGAVSTIAAPQTSSAR
jgi:carboxypeptidase C (cathepsin A)